MHAWLRGARVLALMGSFALVACHAGIPSVTAETADSPARSETKRASDDADALPKALDRLGLSAEQRKQVKAVIADLKTDLKPAKAKRDVFRAAMVSAAQRCSADDSRLHIEANRMVEVGEQARPHVLDAINDFHAILTPKQRAELVDPVLKGEATMSEDTSDGREKGLGEIAAALDLDFIQKVQLIKRAVSRLSVATSETRTIRDQAVEAAKAFKEDDFDVRQHAIAEAPVVKLYTRFVLDLAQVVIPVLTEDQCRTAAGLLRRVFKRSDKSKARSDKQ